MLVRIIYRNRARVSPFLCYSNISKHEHLDRTILELSKKAVAWQIISKFIQHSYSSTAYHVCRVFFMTKITHIETVFFLLVYCIFKNMSNKYAVCLIIKEVYILSFLLKRAGAVFKWEILWSQDFWAASTSISWWWWWLK